MWSIRRPTCAAQNCFLAAGEDLHTHTHTHTHTHAHTHTHTHTHTPRHTLTASCRRGGWHCRPKTLLHEALLSKSCKCRIGRWHCHPEYPPPLTHSQISYLQEKWRMVCCPTNTFTHTLNQFACKRNGRWYAAQLTPSHTLLTNLPAREMADGTAAQLAPSHTLSTNLPARKWRMVCRPTNTFTLHTIHF